MVVIAKSTRLERVCDFLSIMIVEIISFIFVSTNIPPINESKIIANTIIASFITLFIFIFMACVIHECGHALAIKFFKHDAKIKIEFSSTKCDCWDYFSNMQFRIIAIAGVLFKVLVSSLILLVPLKCTYLIVIETVISGMPQLLTKGTRDGHYIKHPEDRTNCKSITTK